MKMRYKILIAFIMLNIIIQLFSLVIFKSWLYGGIILVLEAVMLLAAFAVNRLILSSNWFKYLHADPDHEKYPDNTWYRKHDERNYDLINLGSNSAMYAFDYSDEAVCAMNWSSGTQTLIDDYKLVRNFHSILKEGGTIIITIMPFSSINKKTGLMDAFKFWNVIDYTQTAPEYRRKCRILEKYPFFGGMPAFKAALKVVLGKDKLCVNIGNIDNNPMTVEELKKHAAEMIDNWKQEFSIESLEKPLTDQNIKGREIRLNVMRHMIDFIEERGYRAVFVIPPVSSYLKEYYTKTFLETYIYSYLKQIRRDVPLLDYMADKEFQNKDLYFNSYYLNKRGAKKFTHRVIKDLKELHMI